MARTDDILAKYGVTRGGAAETPAASVSSRGGAEPKTRNARADEILEKYGVSREQRDAGVRESYARRENQAKLDKLRSQHQQLTVDMAFDEAAKVKDEITALEKSAGQHWTQRVGNALSGAAKQTAGGLSAGVSAMYEAGQAGRSEQNEAFRAEQQERYDRAKREYEAMLADNRTSPGLWSEGDLESSINIMEDAKRKGAAMGLVIDEQIQQKAATAARDFSRDVMASGGKDVEKAKTGLTGAGKFAVDVGVGAAQLAGDALLGAITAGGSLAPLALRTFGSGAEEARAEGATLGQQLAYGAGSAALGVAAEKLFSVSKPFKKMFGPGLLDNAVAKALGRMGQTPTGKLALSAISEGGEEFLEAVFQPVLQRATYNKDAAFDLGDALYQAAVGAALGLAGGGVDVALGGKATGTAQEAPPNAAAQRTGQSEGVDMAAQESPAEAPTDPLAQAMFGQQKTAPEVGTGVNEVTTLYAKNKGATSEPYASAEADTSTVRPGRSEPAPIANNTVAQDADSVNSNTVGAAAAGSVNTPYHNLQQDSSQFHDEGANAARPVDVPMYDAQGNPISRFASNVMGAKALPDDVIPMIQQMVAEGGMSYETRTNRYSRMKARVAVRGKGFDGALEQLRADVRQGSGGVDTVALGTELLVNAANAGDAKAVAEICGLMQTVSTNVGQAMQYFTVLRKLDPESQLYAIRRTVGQLNEEIAARQPKKRKGKNIPVEKWMEETGALLAKRLEAVPGAKATNPKTVVDTVLGDLTRYAKNTMPKTDRAGRPRTEAERLADLMGNLPQYTEAWEAAKAKVTEAYGSDPAALAAFEGWLEQDAVSAALSAEGGMTVKVPQALVDKFLAQTDQEGRDAVMEEIYQAVAKRVPSTWMDKWNAWRYLAMLTNPRTHIRNIVGNLGFQPVRVVKNEIAAALERVLGVEEKTKAFAVSPVMYRAAWADFDKAGKLLNGNRYTGVQSEIERRRPIFKNRVLEGVRKGNAAALDFEDAVFKRITYADALAGYLTANGVKAEQLDGGTVPAELLARARDYAAAEALKATYQDDSAAARKVDQLARAMGPAGDALLPFKKTPANIMARGFEYSPAGLAKALTVDLAKVQSGEKSVAEALDAVAAGLTGTGLFSLGAYLFAQGLVTGAQGDDEEDKWADLLGHQGYALELPDGTSVTLDWLAPEALPFFMGVEFMSSVGEAGWTADEIISASIEATKAAANPMMELSMLQGVNDLIESVRYAEDAPLAAMIPSTVTSYLSQAVPTVLGQAERSAEEVRMTTYTDKNSEIPKDLQYAMGRASARIPGVDFNQIPYIDAWGREEDSGDTLVRTLNNTLNPAYTSKVEMDAVEAELQRLYEATGESVFPDRAERYITVDGERKDLTAQEYVKYAKALGQASYDLIREGQQTAEYRAMSDSEKAGYIQDIYKYAGASARAQTGGNPMEGWMLHAKNAKKELGISTAEYIAARQKYDGVVDGSGYDTTRRMVDAGLTLDQWADMKGGVDADGNGSVKKAEVTDYIEANFPQEFWSGIFNAYKGNRNWKNPY